jgi:FAD/FMN-containing dehydrogenase
LGIITKLTLRVEQTYRLHYQARREALADCLSHLEEYKQNNRHFEFFCFPYGDWAQVKFANQSYQAAHKQNIWRKFNELVIENGAFWLLSEACRFVPKLSQPVSRLCGQLISRVDEINHSHRIFATPRMVRFHSMEYNIPAEHFVPALEEIRACIAQEQFQVHFPIECRFVKADDIWLSPAYQRDSAYIAVHTYKGMPYHDYFRAIEEILLRYEGRPHWGKLHTLKAEQLAERYPKWDDFLQLRAELDPQGIFLNDYLRTLFGIQAK